MVLREATHARRSRRQEGSALLHFYSSGLLRGDEEDRAVGATLYPLRGLPQREHVLFIRTRSGRSKVAHQLAVAFGFALLGLITAVLIMALE